MLTAPRPCGFICSPVRGGVDGLTGRGKLFLLENEESRLLGEESGVSDEVETGEKKVATDIEGEGEGATGATAAAPPVQTGDSKGAAKVLGLFSKLGFSVQFCSALISASDSMN